MISLLIILFAWFVQMPLWLSITATVLASIRIMLRISIDVGKIVLED